MKRFNEKKAACLSSAELKTFKGQLLYWIIFAILIVVALCSLIPAIWAVSSAFKKSTEIIADPSFFPKEISWEIAKTRVVDAWVKLDLAPTIVNTLIRSVGELISRLVVCGFGGYVLSKLKPTGSKLLFVLIVWTMMMPGQIRTVPNYISYTAFPFARNYLEEQGLVLGVDVLNTFIPFWLGAGADCYAVLLFKNNFDTLSTSYVEAAKIDGCTNYGVFFKIMFPLSMPIVIYESIGVLSASWADYMGPLIISPDKVTMPLKLYHMSGNATIEYNTYFMGLVFGSIPPFIIFAFFQRRIMGGITVGGVKG
ncbi:MAG: carbohydrate ABC transporter permease [Ruminococcaceae bacterium]|nr:carbohydrate ABC transporter permease [Oscillospiraceae bacterium]